MGYGEEATPVQVHGDGGDQRAGQEDNIQPLVSPGSLAPAGRAVSRAGQEETTATQQAVALLL